jgi:hypothetical protein
MHNENAKMRLVLGKVYRIMNAASGDRGSILNLWKISPLRFAPVEMTGRDRVEMKRRMEVHVRDVTEC